MVRPNFPEPIRGMRPAQVTNNAGQTLSCRMNLFEKARASEFFSEVSREIAEANYGAR